jgi:hypothetical protein
MEFCLLASELFIVELSRIIYHFDEFAVRKDEQA